MKFWESGDYSSYLPLCFLSYFPKHFAISCTDIVSYRTLKILKEKHHKAAENWIIIPNIDLFTHCQQLIFRDDNIIQDRNVILLISSCYFFPYNGTFLCTIKKISLSFIPFRYLKMLINITNTEQEQRIYTFVCSYCTTDILKVWK